MQPKGRRSSNGGLPIPYTAAHARELVSVKKTGDGGIVTVLVGLKWWVSKAGDEWKQAVEDVTAVLGGTPA